MAKFEMSVFEYVDLLAKNSIKNIAKLKGISEATLYNWIKAHKEKIKEVMDKQQPITTEKKPPKTKTTISKKESDTILYQTLYEELQEQAKQDKDLIQRLEAKVSELENLHAACDDVENEVSSLREEKKELQNNCSRLLDDTIEKDRQVENWKHRYKLLMQEQEQLDKQNKTMRELIRQWA